MHYVCGIVSILGQPAKNKLTMMVFRKSKLFEMAAKSSDGRAMNMNRKDISQLNSYVISASIAGRKLSGLKEKVRTIFKPLKVRPMSNRIHRMCHIKTSYQRYP